MPEVRDGDFNHPFHYPISVSVYESECESESDLIKASKNETKKKEGKRERDEVKNG